MRQTFNEKSTQNINFVINKRQAEISQMFTTHIRRTLRWLMAIISIADIYFSISQRKLKKKNHKEKLNYFRESDHSIRRESQFVH